METVYELQSRHQGPPVYNLEDGPGGLASVGAVDLGVDWAVVVAQGVNPIIGIGKSGGGRGLALGLPPHQSLQLPKLIPEVRVVGGDRLSDARVEGADAGLGGGAKVSVALQSADIVAPESGLLREGNVAGVEVQRHRGQLSEGGCLSLFVCCDQRGNNRTPH